MAVFHSDVSRLASLLSSFQKGIPYLATKVKLILYQLSFEKLQVQ